MNMPPIVSPQEWESAREELLVKEKELTRARIASEYIEHYNTERPHRGLGLQPPTHRRASSPA
jgi:transposase InsO family protein